MTSYQCLYGYHGYVVTNLTSVPMVVMVTFVIVDPTVTVVAVVTRAPIAFYFADYETCLTTHEF